ncbi:Hsp20/alpha crystallin family protein [Aestuariicoccus sp. MJ-SS9]|uniref:Hsp20/alpha crystallin family protein n=1 Tax=Aestuariicoccus sp. MJ-SS9 TaxID=3079855 RepID=UPI0029117DA7|nr:Hsp20/alpha crystallin family protein [Aestuariicoccus sp. MJ-SS9]MDU8909843.1 Hsp20/alpha crystallin family protein [Aestuariicoccus sp. MJ-SS9]
MVETDRNSGLWPQLYAPLRGLGHRISDWLSPASDASSDENAYRISVELPGVGEDEVELSVENGVMTVSGEKSATREEKGDTWYFTEREYGSFRRSFRLPGDADADRAEAHMKDGVLNITVPRRAPDKGAGKTIAVKRG